MGHVSEESALHAARVFGTAGLDAELLLNFHELGDISGNAEILRRGGCGVRRGERDTADGVPDGMVLEGGVAVVMDGVVGLTGGDAGADFFEDLVALAAINTFEEFADSLVVVVTAS